jgi:transcriptional regulator with XRE-family HTH domain
MPPVRRAPHQLGRHFLREWREYRAMSLEAVAERLDVDHSTLQRIETFRSPYTQVYLEKLSTIYGCSETDLIKLNPFKADPIAATIESLMAAPENTKRQAAAILDALLKN